MREIKLRAWDKDENEMMKAEGFNYDNGVLIQVKRAGDCWEDNDEHFVLMQGTGVTDKKGVEVYEGDIIKGNHEWFDDPGYRIGKIVYIDGTYTIEWENGSRSHLQYWGNEDSDEDKEFEVIGNIYENPGLIKEEK